MGEHSAFEINPGVAEVGESAHQKLLDDSINMQGAVGTNSIEGDSGKSADKNDFGSGSDDNAADIINEHLQRGREAHEAQEADKAEKGESLRDFIEKGDEGITKELPDDFFKKIDPFKVTPEDRAEAKKDLQDMIPKIVGDGDRKVMVSLQESVLDGNVEKLGNVLDNLREDPERMGRFIDELNTQLKKSGSDTRLTRTEDGRVFLHDRGSDLAVQFNKDGNPEVKQVEYTRNGSLVVKPGEVIGSTASDVASDIGDQTVRDMTYQKPIHKLPDFQVIPRDGGIKPREWLKELNEKGAAGATQLEKDK